MNKQELLIIRDVISREIYELENKIIQCRISKMKYKYLEDRKETLSKFLTVELDDRILIHYEHIETNIPMPTL